MAHTKATGTEEVLKRMEKELRSKLEESKTENHCLAVKVTKSHKETVTGVSIYVEFMQLGANRYQRVVMLMQD